MVHPTPVPVVYDAVNELTAALYDTTYPCQLWLHLGVSDQGDFYTLEKGAHRDGYTTVDEADLLPDEKKQPAYWKTTAEYLETTAGLPDVLARWHGVCPVRIFLKTSWKLSEALLHVSNT